MKRTWISLWMGLGCAARLLGAMAPAPDLLPAETVGFVTAPDWLKATAAWKSSNLGRLWEDPSMRAFRAKFEERFNAEVGGHLEKQLGIKSSEFLALAKGQVTFAVFRRGGAIDGKPSHGVPWLILVDAGEPAAAKAWVDTSGRHMRDAKRTLKTTKIRDIEFQTLVLTPVEFSELTGGMLDEKPGDDDDEEDDTPPGKAKKEKAQPKTIEVHIGASGSSVLIGTQPGSIERVLAKLKGADAPVLSSQERYQAAQKSVLKGGQIQAWVDMAPFTSAAQSSLGGVFSMIGADPARVLTALGLDAVQWGAFQLQQGPDGTFAQGSLSVPQTQRVGLFKVLQAEAKDSSPPAFVPRDAIKFQRWRLNGPKTWKSLEDAVNQISPQLVGIFKLALESAGQQEDPNFSFKTEFVDRLGDDFITFEKPAKGKTLPELNNPPSLLLLGSPKPERLANGLRALLVMGQLQSRGGGVQVREFLGRKIYSARMNVPGGGKNGGQIHMAAGISYVAISSDAAIVEEYLRTTGDAPKALKDFPGLAGAADHVGGLNTGVFVFENQLEGSRTSWELMRKGGSLDKMMPPGTANLATARAISDWADFSLLPDFEKVAKYFTFGVLTGSNDAQGFAVKWFNPTAR